MSVKRKFVLLQAIFENLIRLLQTENMHLNKKLPPPTRSNFSRDFSFRQDYHSPAALVIRTSVAGLWRVCRCRDAMTDTITIPISEYGYAAFSASVPLDFGAVPDCEVYYLPHYSYAELQLKRVKGVAPAHFGVLIASL